MDHETPTEPETGTDETREPMNDETGTPYGDDADSMPVSYTHLTLPTNREV